MTLLPLLYDALRELYDKPRTGVHVSDLLCPRESLFRKVKPKPITNLELGFYLLGRGLHDAAQALVKKDPEFEIESEVYFDKELEAHIDLYWKARNIPIELKTARVSNMDEPKPHYLDQLHAYMAMTNAETGIIVVFMITHYQNKLNKDTPLKEWEIKMTPEHREAKRAWLVKEQNDYRKALDAGDPSLARTILLDEALNWKCNSCKYKVECQDIEAAKK